MPIDFAALIEKLEEGIIDVTKEQIICGTGVPDGGLKDAPSLGGGSILYALQWMKDNRKVYPVPVFRLEPSGGTLAWEIKSSATGELIFYRPPKALRGRIGISEPITALAEVANRLLSKLADVIPDAQ